MVREDTDSSASRSTNIRKKSPARTKSPSRKGLASNSPETKPQETTKKTRERSSGRKTPERSKSPSRVVKDKSLPKITKEKSPSRPARTKSPSRPARTKSPSRPARTKSPGRTKSPSRVSPSRTVAGDAKVIIKKVSVQINKNEIELSGSDEDIPIEKPRATVKGRSRKFELEDILQPSVKYTVRTESYNTMSNEVRRLTRSSQSQERVVHLKNFDTVPKKLGEFSDDESTVTQSVKQSKVSFKELFEVLHFILFTPVFVIALYLLCSESKCTLFSLPEWKNYQSLNYFFNLHAFIGYSVVAVLVAVLSTLPFGGEKVCSLPSKQPKFTYVLNGKLSLLVILSLALALESSGYKISTFIVEHIFHLMISSILLGTLFSVYLYIRSFYVPISSLNSDLVDSSLLIGFFYGREVNPRLGNILDFKIYLLRLYALTLILIDGALLVKGLELDTKIGPAIQNLDWKPLLSNPTLLVIVTLHLIYFAGHLAYEARALSSYFIQYEAPGFATNIGILLYPFQMILQTKHILDHKVEYANWELGILCLAYLIGYVIFTVSNNQKDSFRKNPYSTVSAKFESIPTSQGKRILCSGCWGVVRQPNIIGDIIVHLVLLRFGFDAYPVFAVASIIHMLVGRAITSQADCKNKYGAAWDKYCEKVKYVLIPLVY